MRLIGAYHSDVGIRKKTNQDALLLMEANTRLGAVALAVICDGMGGLAEGEVASGTVCVGFQQWFLEELPALIEVDCSEGDVKASWEELVFALNARMLSYGDFHHLSLGTTLTALLLIGTRYLIINIGDSRVYELSDSLHQLTKDQTVVQREVDLGMITQEDAERDPRANILLQCIGASESIQPQFIMGDTVCDTVYLLCSDGYRHQIRLKELWDHLNPQVIQTEQQLTNNIVYLTDLNKHRRESDNISAVAIKVEAG
ncbi:MAG: serine/threonine-protein phosphatase [Coriobacteriales bacterium]|jgi:serine/threonine protein phosphatase PrpC|nr:serine/threonine-protein phosphatase [Coriobacteriales bacterium]